MNDLWNVVLTQESGQEGLRGFGISVPLKEDIEHEAVLVYRPPEPVTDTIYRCTTLIQIPPGTP